MTNPVGRVTFETNIKLIAAEIAQGMSSISASLAAEQAKGAAGNPAALVETQVGAQMARLVEAGRVAALQIREAFAQEAARSQLTNTPFVNPAITNRGGTASEQLAAVEQELAAVTQATLAVIPETFHAAAPGFQALAQQTAAEVRVSLGNLISRVTAELNTIATVPGSGLPSKAIGQPVALAVAEEVQAQQSRDALGRFNGPPPTPTPRDESGRFAPSNYVNPAVLEAQVAQANAAELDAVNIEQHIAAIRAASVAAEGSAKADAVLTETVLTRAQQERVAAAAAREASQPRGIIQGSVGGFTSRGFNTIGDTTQTFQQDITNLAGTAGVLAKYSLAGAAVTEVSKALNELRTGTIEYTDSVEKLNVILAAHNEGLSKAQQATVDLNSAQQAGATVGLDLNSAIDVGVNALAVYGNELTAGANAADVFNTAITQAGVNVLITGQKADEAAKQLQAITQAYQTGYKGMAEANDAIQTAFEHFGGNQAEISQGVAASAPLASEGGISEQQLANMVALINARSSQSGAQIATTIERLVSRSQNAQFLKALSTAGVADTGNVSQELGGLSEAYNKASKPGQLLLEAQLGSARALTGLVPLLRGYNEVVTNTAKSYDEAGHGQDAANKKLESFGGQLVTLGATVKTLLVDIGKSGFLAPIGVALELIAPPLRIVTAALGEFDKLIPGVGRNIVGLTIDLGLGALAFKAYQVNALAGSTVGKALATVNEASAVSAKANASATWAAAEAASAEAETAAAVEIATKARTAAELAGADATGLWVTADEAAELADRALAVQISLGNVAFEARAIAAGEAAVAMGAAVDAEAAVAASGGKFAIGQALSAGSGGAAGRLVATSGAAGAGGIAGLGAAATLGIVAVGLAAVALGDQAIHLAGSLGEVNKAMADVTHGSLTDLQASISQLATARSNLNKQSSGLLGSTVNFLEGDPASAARKNITDQIKELTDEAIALRDASIAVGAKSPSAVFGPDGPASVAVLAQGLTTLKDSGASASVQLAALITTIDGLTGASTRVADKLVPGSLVVAGGGPVGLTGNVLDALKNLPTSVRSTALQNLNSFDAESRNRLLGQLGVKAAGTATPGVRTDDTGPRTDLAVTGFQPTPAQQKALQLAVANDLTSLGKKAGDALSPAQQADLATKMAQAFDPKGQLAALGVSMQPIFLAELKREASVPLTRTNILQDPTIINKAAEDAIAASQQTISEASARGDSASSIIGDNQTSLANLQHIAASLKSAGFSVDDSQFSELKQALAVGQKQTFDAFVTKVDQLKTLAQATADPTQRAAIDHEVAVLEAEANGLDASLLPSNFTLAQLPGLIKAAQARQLANEQKVLTAAKLIDEGIIAGLEDKLIVLEDLMDPKFEALIRRIEADIAAAKAKLAGEKLPTQPLSDVAFGDTHDPTTAGTTAPTDTAEQIAAAQYGASIFPGNKVGEAAAALRKAQADLDAQQAKGSNTVAFYDALKGLHAAQLTYADAVLASQDQSRLLNIDRTNPLLVAQEKVRTDAAKLASDRGAGADSGTLTADRIALQDAQASAEQTKFSQRLTDAQLSEQLGRTSHAAYLSYLQNEHNRLAVIRVKTYQQQQELNQIDQAIKAASDQMAGQFNLGAIKVPTIYEVRRAIANQHLASGGDTGYQDNRVVTITVNGGDVAKLTTLLKDSLGTTATSRITVAPRKS